MKVPAITFILTAEFSLFANAGIFDGIGSNLTLGKSADIRPTAQIFWKAFK